MDLDLQRLIRRDARRIAVTYLFVAAIWIWGSDFLLQVWFPDPRLGLVLQTVKGIVFVLVTAVLLYSSVRGQLLQRTTIEQVLQSTRSFGEAIFHSANDAILVLDQRHVVRDANPKAEELYSYSRNALIGLPLDRLLVGSSAFEELRSALERGSGRWETWHRRADGSTFPVEVSMRLLEWDRTPNAVLLVRDITMRMEFQDRIERLNRIYAFLSDVNQTIVRVRDEEKLFRETGRIAVEKGGFRLAWIGAVDEGHTTVRVVTSAGPAIGYLEGMSISLEIGPTSRGPTALAIARGSHVVCNDIEHDARMEPWRDRAESYGLRSVASFPIKRAGVAAFVLNVYSDETGYFDDQEIELLDEMASDVSFALTFNDTLRRLEEHEAIISAFMDNLPGVAFIKDAELRHRLVNREFERTLNVRASDVLEKRIDAVIPGPDAENMIANDRRVLRGGHSLLAEESLFVGGSHKTFLSSKFPIRRPDGTVWLGGVAIDITERKLAAERLQYQAQLLSQMESVAKIGAWEFDPSTGKGTWTPGVARIHDVDPADETNVQRGLSFYAGDDRTRIEAAIRAAVERATPYDLELELTTAHGKKKWVHTMGYPLIQDGRVVKVYGSFQDITDRKLAEHSLRRTEQQLRLFVEHAPASIAMFDRDMRYIMASQRYSTDYGIEDRDVRGRSHYDVFPEIPERWKEIHRRCLTGAVERADRDPFVRKNGTTDWVRWEIRPWWERTGEIGGLMLFSEVISDRVRIDEEITEANRRLRALAQQMVTAREEERKMMAREIHDQLGQELTAIRMDLSMAASAPTAEGARDQLRSATAVTDRAIATVRRLARELRPDVLDQLGLVEALKWLASEHETHTRIPCRFRVVGEEPKLDDTAATTLFRVAQESLTNVVRHAQARTVEILLQVRPNVAELEVLDDGRGADTDRLSRPSGVGIIGMRERVEALGGSFEIGPRPEGGTRVLVQLVLAAPSRTETAG